MTKPTIRRTRRSDAQPVLALTFPEGTTQEAVTAALVTYGMEGYTVSQEGNVFRAMRGDLQSIAKDGTIDIKLNAEGVVATVTRTDALTPSTAEGAKNGLTMTAIQFDADKFDETQIAEWLTRNSIDSKITTDENSEQAYVVRRSAAPEGEETRMIGLEEGVTAIIVRSDAYDIPDGYYAAVCEAAYGNWGWGHLDFAATIADVAFSEQMRAAVGSLDEVLRNILFYSSLPLDVRKTLVTGALEQFGTFTNALMDSLPRQLLVSVVRSAQPNLENSMTKAANEGGATTTATPATSAPAATALPVTRAEFDAAVAAGVDAALVKRAEAEKAAAEAATAAAAEKAAGAAPAAALTRSDLASIFAEGVKPLTDRLEKLEGATIVRSEGTDPVVVQTAEQKAAEAAEAKKPENVFRGAFPSLIGRQSK